jgi:uridylate kinase
VENYVPKDSHHMDKGKIVIFAGGTGSPFYD